MAARPKVVIVGGGFGGLYAAKAFQGVPVDVTIIDKENYHLFRPLLYQVAMAGLSAGDIAAPLREIFRQHKNIRTLLGEVSAIDVEQRQVIYNGGILPYDAVIVATGSDYTYFGHDQWRPYALSLDGLRNALEMRRRLLSAYEHAEQEPDAEQRQALMTFIIIGGGPTGVELAGAIAEMARHTLPEDFRVALPSQTRVILIEASDRLLGALPLDLSEKARQALAKLGVTGRTGTKVMEITNTCVVVEVPAGGQERIRCQVAMWAAGVKASELSHMLHERAGVALDRAGRVQVAPDLSIPHYPTLFVARGYGAPGACGTSIAGAGPGGHAARRPCGTADRADDCAPRGNPPNRSADADRGTMATIGRAAAVADLRGIHLSGFLAWLIWLFVHLMYLVGSS